MSESPSLSSQAHQEKHPPSWFSVRARRCGADSADQTLKEIALSDRIVRPTDRMRSASKLQASEHSAPGSATWALAPRRKSETFPRNQSRGRVKREVKRKQA